MHLCIPGIYTDFVCPMVETIIEFAEYHLSMDIQHIHFGVDYVWGSKSMNNFLKVWMDRWMSAVIWMDGCNVMSYIGVNG